MEAVMGLLGFIVVVMVLTVIGEICLIIFPTEEDENEKRH
jgi:hypothetical protein